MNTPAHLIFGLAAFGRARPHPQSRALSVAALSGALLPDLSLYLMAGVSLFVLGLSPEYVFGTLYFSDAWQAVFAVDNSLVIWSVVFALAAWRRHAVAMAFAGSGWLHLVLDFGLHNDDARRHFWPISDWVYTSPVSYWDPAHHGTLVGGVEIAFSLVLCVMLWQRYRDLWPRVGIAALGLAEAAPIIVWTLMFD